MRIEICPVHGEICRSIYADLYFQHATYSAIKELLMTKEIETSPYGAFIPLEKMYEFGRGQGKIMKALSPHPPDAFVVGLLIDPSQPLTLAIARTERKQRDLTDRGLLEDTKAEGKKLQGAIARFKPLIRKIKAGAANAEDVVAALKSEDDPKVARERLNAMLAATSTIRDEEEILISTDARLYSKKFAASKAYSLKVRVTALEESPATAKLVLIGNELPESLFWANDIGIRTITTSVTDPNDFFLLNMCMAYKLPVLVDLAVELDIGGSGRTYTAALIRIADQKSTWNAVHAVSRSQSDDLFQ